MPSRCRPSIASRTPSTCPAQRWPWACSASRRYSSKDFTKAAASSQTSAFSLTLPEESIESGIRHAGDPSLRRENGPAQHDARRGCPLDSLPSPADSILGDLGKNSGLGKRCPNGVGFLEIPSGSSRLHFGDLGFDVGIGELR